MEYEQKVGIGLKYVFDLLSPLSAFGKEKLKRLSFYKSCEHNALTNEFENIERLARLLKSDSHALSLVLHALAGMKDITGTLTRLKNEELLDVVELFELKTFLTLSAKLKYELEKLGKGLSLCNIKFFDTQAALQLLSLGGEGGFFISDEYSATLKEIRIKKAEINKCLEQAAEVKHKEELKKLHLKTFVAEDEEEGKVRKQICKNLSQYAEAMLANAETTAHFDLLIQKAVLANRFNMAKPKIGAKLQFVDMTNPMLEQQFLGKNFTKISFEASSGTTVITGANMGGKTVALKTICLNTCLALCGFFVFAAFAEVPLFDFVEIMSDNLNAGERGLSSFGSEIVKINNLFLKTKKEFGLILADEFAGGTNAEEGTKIFRAVVKSFNVSNCIAIMTTHFDGVASCAVAHYQVAGLKKLPSTRGYDGEKGIELIAKYMDYGLLSVSKETGVPKDALAVCSFLGLDEQIMKKL